MYTATATDIYIEMIMWRNNWLPSKWGFGISQYITTGSHPCCVLHKGDLSQNTHQTIVVCVALNQTINQSSTTRIVNIDSRCPSLAVPPLIHQESPTTCGSVRRRRRQRLKRSCQAGCASGGRSGREGGRSEGSSGDPPRHSAPSYSPEHHNLNRRYFSPDYLSDTCQGHKAPQLLH